MILTLQILLIALFLLTAAYLDSENRRVNATNTRLLRQRRKAAIRIVRLRRALADTELANEGLTEELDNWRAGAAAKKSVAKALVH